MIVRTNYENEVKFFEIQGDTVYVRSNIREIIDSDGDRVWEYEEKTLSLMDYIKQNYMNLEELIMLISNNQNRIDKAIAELSILIGGIMKNV